MAKLTIQIPEVLKADSDGTVRLIAAKLYEADKLSLGQAAEMCNMKKWDFPQVLAQNGVSYFQYSGDDLLNEFK
jgi:predicted HTH domain antitoxin